MVIDSLKKTDSLYKEKLKLKDSELSKCNDLVISKNELLDVQNKHQESLNEQIKEKDKRIKWMGYIIGGLATLNIFQLIKQ